MTLKIQKLNMAENYVNLPVNQPTFNWDSTNVIEEWKRFCGQVELLLVDGPYSTMNEKAKVATLQNWMTDRGQKIFKDELIFPKKRDPTRRTVKSLMMFSMFLKLISPRFSQ